MAKEIGITGGMGAGKSTIAKIIEGKGFPVFYADNVAKSFLAHDADTIGAIKNLLGEKSYLSNGEPNRKFIAEQIFGNDELRDKLNKIIHPKVKIAYAQFVADHQDKEIVFHEAALIYQAGFDKFIDSVIFVSCSIAKRIERLLNRSGITQNDIMSRIKAQGNLDEYEKRSAYIIRNEGSLNQLESEVSNVISRITALD